MKSESLKRKIFLPLAPAIILALSVFITTTLVTNTRKSIFFLSGFYLFLGITIFFLFYRLISGIERELAEARARLIEESRREEIQRQRADELQRIDKELEIKVEERTQELIAAQERYRTVLHAVMDGFWIADTQGRLLEVNDAYCRLIGYSREELLSMSIKDVEVLETPEEVAAHIQRIIASGEDHFESRHRCKDGRIVDIEVSVKYISHKEGGRIFYFLRDITARKRAEEALRESESKFRNWAEYSLVGVYLIQDGVFKYVNPVLAQMFGYSIEEMVGKNPRDFTLPADWPIVEENLRKRIMGEVNSINYDFRGITKNKEILNIEVYGSGVVFQGRPAIIGTALNITERKRADEELHRNYAIQAAINSILSLSLENIGLEELLVRTLELILSIPWLATASKGNLFLVEDDPPVLVMKAQRDIPEEIQKKCAKVPFGKCICGQAALTGKVQFVECVDSRHEIMHDFSFPHGHYCVPIISAAKTLGVINIYLKEGHKRNKEEEDFLVDIANTLAGTIERKQAEKALRESQERLSAIISNTPNVAVEGYDIDGRVLYWNRAAEQIFGWTEKEAMGKTLDQLILDKKSTDEFNNILRDTERLNRPFGPSEWKFKNKDGQEGVVYSTIFPIPAGDGKKEFVCMDVDITDRKKAEEERKKLNEKIIKSNERLRRMALRDSHTGLYNHRYLTEIIEAEFDRAKRYNNPLSVIMLDIDYFKSINDVYGHPFGDLVLKQFARQLKQMVRRYDIVVRFGGEEFIIVSPGSDRSTAMILAQRILDAVNLYNFGNKEHTVKLKLSLAVASYPEDIVVKGMGLIELTDQILNRVKEFGGNRVYSFLDIKKQKPTTENKEQAEVKILKEKLAKLTKRANQSLIEAIFAFAKTIKLKDHYTGEHVEKTSFYATEIARALSLSREEIEHVRQASILHDLGKIGVSEKILLKREQLTKEELAEVKKHPQIGVDIIRPIQFLHAIIPLILYHHERWDGKGYPNSLRGEEIPVGARILAIADVYQALISNRPYRQAYSREEAIKIIKEGSGSQFDPAIINIFLEILRQEQEK